MDFHPIHQNPATTMDHLLFRTELDLTQAEKKSLLRTYILRCAVANCQDSGRQVAQEMCRVEKMLMDPAIFQLIPVDDQAVLARREMAKAM